MPPCIYLILELSFVHFLFGDIWSARDVRQESIFDSLSTIRLHGSPPHLLSWNGYFQLHGFVFEVSVCLTCDELEMSELHTQTGRT